jgi:tetratricopeptide (TPR) repeat protein
VIRLASLLLLLAACADRQSSPHIREGSIAQRLLRAANGLTALPEADRTAGAKELERLASTIRAALDHHGHEPAVDVINHIIFGREQFSREVDDRGLEFALLPSVLRARRGSCVGLGTLYLALGDLLGIPMRGILLPGHFFVRTWDDSGWRNVELLREGEQHPSDWYRARWPLPPTTTPVYDRVLSDDEVLAVVEYDIGNDLRRRGRVQQARRAFERAVAHFPSFPEAEASLGAMMQLEGELDAAAGAYAVAKKVSPLLSGIDDNIRLLVDERRSAGAVELVRRPSKPE